MMQSKKLREIIIPLDEKNSARDQYPVLGINRDKEFMPTAANMEGIDTAKYKVVRKGTFVFSGMQTGRDICIRIALYDKEEPCLISPAYSTFSIDESKGILSEFLFVFFKRAEMDRYGAFLSDSSVRANLDWERFLDIEIPAPPLKKQEAVRDIYRSYIESKRLMQEHERMFSSIWPSLIKDCIK